MYNNKVPKSQKPDSGLYTIHHCHNTDHPVEWYLRVDETRVVSIDPGLKNFCFRIEHRNKITGIITMEAFEKIDLIGDYIDGKSLVVVLYRNSILLLEKFIDLIYNSHLVIIERQLSKNYKMVRFSQHIISYLTMRLMDNPYKTVILEIDSKLKSRQLNAPKGLNAKEIKKWSIQRADVVLKIRKDQNSLNIIKKAKSKKDDLSDAINQIEAVFDHFGLPITIIDAPINNHIKNNYYLYNPNNSIGNILPTIYHEYLTPVKLDLTGIDFSKIDLNPTPVKLDSTPVKLDLTGIDFSKIELTGIDFSKLKL
jgi:hypothetical protein